MSVFDRLRGASLELSPVWSWPLVGLAIVVVAVVIVAGYAARLRGLPPGRRRLLLGLRLAVVLLLLFALLRPSLRQVEPDSQPRVFVIMMDLSRSMTIRDGAGGVTRRQALVDTIARHRERLESLGDNVEIRLYDFDRDLRLLDGDPSAEANGDQTALGAVLEALLRESRESQGERIAGAVLLSDGAQRAVPPLDIDPLGVARTLGDHGLRVHTVPFGAAAVDSAVDVAVEDLQVDRVVFAKTAVIVRVRVRISGAANRDVQLRLLVEDRTGCSVGESGPLKVPPAAERTSPTTRVNTSNNSHVRLVELSYVPRQPGEFVIAVEAVPLDGELRTVNNRRRSLITVRRGGIKVAYFDRARFEFQSLQLLRASDKIQLDAHVVRAGRSRIDPKVFEPGQYDVYVLGDVPASAFGTRNLSSLAARVGDGSGLVMLGGFHSFGLGGYATSPLRDLLPVAMSPAEKQNDDVDVPTDLHLLEDIRMLPTDAGLVHYVMRVASTGELNRQRWAMLPPLEKANRLRPRNEFVDVLAATPDGTPLLFAHDTGTGRVMALAVDTTHLWFRYGHLELHQRFWQQMILWLARKEDDKDQAVWVRVDPRTFNVSAAVPVEFGARDEAGRPLQDAGFTVQVLAPDSEQHDLVPRAGADGHSATFVKTSKPGDYWVKVSASHQGQQLGLEARTRFLVDARDLELNNPAADPALLEQIATLSGGARFAPERFDELLDQLAETPSPSGRKQATRTDLWDNGWLLCLFVTLISSEWFLRKKQGLV